MRTNGPGRVFVAKNLFLTVHNGPDELFVVDVAVGILVSGQQLLDLKQKTIRIIQMKVLTTSSKSFSSDNKLKKKKKKIGGRNRSN